MSPLSRLHTLVTAWIQGRGSSRLRTKPSLARRSVFESLESRYALAAYTTVSVPDAMSSGFGATFNPPTDFVQTYNPLGDKYIAGISADVLVSGNTRGTAVLGVPSSNSPYPKTATASYEIEDSTFQHIELRIPDAFYAQAEAANGLNGYPSVTPRISGTFEPQSPIFGVTFPGSGTVTVTNWTVTFYTRPHGDISLDQVHVVTDPDNSQLYTLEAEYSTKLFSSSSIDYEPAFTDVDTRELGKVRLAVYSSFDQTLDANDVPGNTRLVNRFLGAGSARTFLDQRSFNDMKDYPYLIIKADPEYVRVPTGGQPPWVWRQPLYPNGVIQESNEDNNVIVIANPAFAVKAEVSTVSFKGDTFTPIISDDSSTIYDGTTVTHWASPNPTEQFGHAYPALYAVGGQIIVDAEFRITSSVSTALVRGDGPDDFDFPQSVATVANGLIAASNLAATTRFDDEIRYLDEFAISWEVSIDGGRSWISAGRSTNTVYVSASPPRTKDLFWTVVDIAVRNSAGLKGNDEERIIDATWREFDASLDLIVQRVDGERLYYYKDALTKANTVSRLLTGQDGTCDAWRDLFLDALAINGIYKENSRVVIVPNARDEQLLMSGAVLLGAGHGAGKYPFINAVLLGPDKKPLPKPVLDIEFGTPPRAQGPTRPPQVFVYHAVVLIDGVYYDPSYGRSYPSLQEFQDKAMAGFLLKGVNALPTQPFSESRFVEDANGDGDKRDVFNYSQKEDVFGARGVKKGSLELHIERDILNDPIVAAVHRFTPPEATLRSTVKDLPNLHIPISGVRTHMRVVPRQLLASDVAVARSHASDISPLETLSQLRKRMPRVGKLTSDSTEVSSSAAMWPKHLTRATADRIVTLNEQTKIDWRCS